MERLVTLSKVIERLGPIKGEKSLQKMIYLIDSYGYKLGYQYSWQHYGPTSFQLQQDVLELQGLGLIDISFDHNIPVYTGKTSYDHLNQFWRKQQESYQMQTSLQKMIKFMQGLGEKRQDPDFLEVMASLDYKEKQSVTYNNSSLNNSQLFDTAKQTLDQLHDFL